MHVLEKKTISVLLGVISVDLGNYRYGGLTNNRIVDTKRD